MRRGRRIRPWASYRLVGQGSADSDHLSEPHDSLRTPENRQVLRRRITVPQPRHKTADVYGIQRDVPRNYVTRRHDGTIASTQSGEGFWAPRGVAPIRYRPYGRPWPSVHLTCRRIPYRLRPRFAASPTPATSPSVPSTPGGIEVANGVGASAWLQSFLQPPVVSTAGRVNRQSCKTGRRE